MCRSTTNIWTPPQPPSFVSGRGRHPASLNFGDCMSYAIASVAGMPSPAKISARPTSPKPEAIAEGDQRRAGFPKAALGLPCPAERAIPGLSSVAPPRLFRSPYLASSSPHVSPAKPGGHPPLPMNPTQFTVFTNASASALRMLPSAIWIMGPLTSRNTILAVFPLWDDDDADNDPTRFLLAPSSAR